MIQIGIADQARHAVVRTTAGFSNAVADWTIIAYHEMQSMFISETLNDMGATLEEKFKHLELVQQWEDAQKEAVEKSITGKFGIDPKDSLYQNVRSGTLMTLEYGPLVVGGIKGASKLCKIASAKLAKLPKRFTKSARVGNGFFGYNDFKLKNATYQPYRNHALRIQNRIYSGHALDQMQNRGIMPTLVEDTIKNGISSIGRRENTINYHNRINNIFVVLNEEGTVVTTFMKSK